MNIKPSRVFNIGVALEAEKLRLLDTRQISAIIRALSVELRQKSKDLRAEATQLRAEAAEISSR